MTTVTRRIHFAVKENRKRVRLGPPRESKSSQGRIPRVSKLMALAIRFDHLLRTGTVPTLSELARLAQVSQPRMTQIMNLLHLAPDIQEEILHLPPVYEGRDPVTEHDLRNVVQHFDWAVQRAMWKVTRDARPAPRT